MAIFNSFLYVYQRVSYELVWIQAAAARRFPKIFPPTSTNKPRNWFCQAKSDLKGDAVDSKEMVKD